MKSKKSNLSSLQSEKATLGGFIRRLNVDVPTVLGVGISGPVIATLTATLFSAFRGVFGWGEEAYPVIMGLLCCILAVFPLAKAEYKSWLKVVLFPLVAAVIFSSAWGANSGMADGERAVTPDPESKIVTHSSSMSSTYFYENPTEEISRFFLK